jgi:hypothetical protein
VLLGLVSRADTCGVRAGLGFFLDWAATLSPVVAGTAFYGWSARVYSASRDNCGVQSIPGTNVSLAVPLVVFIAVPGLLVAWRSRRAGRAWSQVTLLVMAAVAAACVAVFFGHLIAANDYNCL